MTATSATCSTGTAGASTASTWIWCGRATGPAPTATAATAPTRSTDPGPDMAARSRDAILDATRALLGEVGYARLSIDGVAKRAGVGRPTIYRWWPDKSHLVFDAVGDLADALDEEL